VSRGAARLTVRLTPRAGRDRIDGAVEGALRVRVAAPPVDGAANRSLVALLADELGLGKTSVRIVAGETGRTKVVELDGVDPAVLVERWPDLGS
jgi:uncharacterized protein (TIGR00251 family)